MNVEVMNHFGRNLGIYVKLTLVIFLMSYIQPLIDISQVGIGLQFIKIFISLIELMIIATFYSDIWSKYDRNKVYIGEFFMYFSLSAIGVYVFSIIGNSQTFEGSIMVYNVAIFIVFTYLIYEPENTNRFIKILAIGGLLVAISRILLMSLEIDTLIAHVVKSSFGTETTPLTIEAFKILIIKLLILIVTNSLVFTIWNNFASYINETNGIISDKEFVQYENSNSPERGYYNPNQWKYDSNQNTTNNNDFQNN